MLKTIEKKDTILGISEANCRIVIESYALSIISLASVIYAQVGKPLCASFPFLLKIVAQMFDPYAVH